MYETIARLVPDSHRITMQWAADKVLADTSLLPLLIEAILADQYPLSMRASRVLNFVVEKQEELFAEYQNALVEKLPQFREEGAIRSLFWIFSKKTHLVSAHNHGAIVDYAFGTLMSDKAVAIKAYCLDFLVEMLRIYPEIKTELQLALEQMSVYQEPSMVSKVRTVGRKLSGL